MEFKRYETGPRLSRVVEYGGVLHFCGHVGEGATITEQAASLLDRFDALLEQYGSDKRRLLTAAVFLSDIALKPEFDAVWDAWIEPGTAPTRYCVQATLGSPDHLAEVVITAAKK